MFYVLEDLKGWYKRSGLPHYDSDLVYQFITFRLHDSVPYNIIENWKAELSIIKKEDNESEEYQELQRKIFKYEDKGYGSCYLKFPIIYQLVESTFMRFNHVKYELISWVIMPNHVHLLIRQLNGYSIGEIVQSWKVYTAKMANKILNRQGKFWMNDYYDRYIRNESHYYRVLEYIDNNDKKKER